MNILTSNIKVAFNSQIRVKSSLNYKTIGVRHLEKFLPSDEAKLIISVRDNILKGLNYDNNIVSRYAYYNILAIKNFGFNNWRKRAVKINFETFLDLCCSNQDNFQILVDRSKVHRISKFVNR